MLLAIVVKNLCVNLLLKHFGALVLGEEPTQPLNVDPLMIRYGEFFVGGASWVRYRQKVQNARLSNFLGLRYQRMRQKEEYLQHFIASLDLFVLVNRHHLRRKLRRA